MGEENSRYQGTEPDYRPMLKDIIRDSGSPEEMRNLRLNHFFATGQFRNTPIQYMSAMDQLKYLWAKEDEEKKAKEAAQKEADLKSKATKPFNN